MGLNITAYRSLKKAEGVETDEDGSPVDWGRYHYFSVGLMELTAENWGSRAEPIEPGIYEATEKMKFGAGSYGRYNQWREWLAKAAGWPLGTFTSYNDEERSTHAGAAWNATEGPFWELINFSDCEGIIGTTACAKLAKDFAEHREKILVGADIWQADMYDVWHRAFVIGADGGCVYFH